MAEDEKVYFCFVGKILGKTNILPPVFTKTPQQKEEELINIRNIKKKRMR